MCVCVCVKAGQVYLDMSLMLACHDWLDDFPCYCIDWHFICCLLPKLVESKGGTVHVLCMTIFSC